MTPPAQTGATSPVKPLEVRTATEWEKWLEANHLKKKGVWLVYHKERTGPASISYEESIETAIAYGWVDSLVKRFDEATYARKFTPRRPGSNWSRTNIIRLERLKSSGRITRWGLEAYEARTGRKSLGEKLHNVELEVPDDLRAALEENGRASANFESFSPSRRKRYLMWIGTAKRPETRRKRVEEAIELISKNVKDLLK